MGTAAAALGSYQGTSRLSLAHGASERRHARQVPGRLIEGVRWAPDKRNKPEADFHRSMVERLNPPQVAGELSTTSPRTPERWGVRQGWAELNTEGVKNGVLTAAPTALGGAQAGPETYIDLSY